VPYAVLGAMTFPAVFSATGSLPSALAGTAVALVLGWMEKGLLTVAVFACIAAFAAGLKL
jgi:branched-subunit amino acid transport protein